MDDLLTLGEQKKDWNEGVKVEDTIHSVKPFTQKQHRQVEAQEEAVAKKAAELDANTSYWDVAKAAAGQSVTNLAYEYFKNSQKWKPDANFVLTKDKLDKAMTGIPEEYISEFDTDIQSQEHLDSIAENVRVQMKRNETIAAKGLAPAVVAMIGTAVADPVSVVTTAATGGALAPLLYAGRATRVANLVRGAAAGVATSVPTEVIQANLDIDYGVSDALMGLAAGGLIGGAMGGIAKVDVNVSKALAKASEKLDTEAAMKAGYIPKTPEQQAEPRETSMSAFRFDRASYNMSSVNPETRKMSSMFLHDPNPQKGAFVEETTVETAQKLSDTWSTRYVVSKESALSDYRKELTAKGEKFDLDRFNDEVWLARHGQPSESKAVNQLAEHLRKYYDEIGEEIEGFSKRDGVPVQGSGFKDNPFYMNREWSKSRITAMVQAAGGGTAGIKAVAKELAPHIKGYTEAVARDVAEHIVEMTQLTRNAGVRFNGYQGDIDGLYAMLKRELGLADDTARAFADRLHRTVKGADAGNAGNLKFRIDLDEIAAKDFLETDPTKLFTTYARSMSGHIALARKGFASEQAARDAVRELRTSYAHMKNPPSEKRINTELKNLEDAISHTLGRAIDDPTNPYAGGARIIRKVNFTRLMNMMGISALVDAFNVVAHSGVKATFKHLPQLKTMVAQLKDGKFSNEFANDLVIATGWGKRHWVMKDTQRIEQVGVNGQVDTSFWGKVEGGLDKAGRFTSHISGMNIVQEATHILAGASMLQTYMDAFRKGKPHRLGRDRLNEMGMSEELYEQVRQQFMSKGGASWDASGKLTRVHWDKWDKETATKFQLSLRRWGTFLSQEQGFGSLPQLADTWYGQLLLQFRTFVLGAWTKQTLNNLKHHDMTSLNVMTATFMGGVLSYGIYGAIRMGSITDPVKRDKEWQRLFDPEGTGEVDLGHIGMNALVRTGFASIIPSVTDTVVGHARGEPIFGERNSGLKNDITGLPFIDLALKTSAVAGSFADSIRQGAPTAELATSFQAITTANNIAFFSGHLRSLLEDTLPENEQSNN